MDNHAKGWLAAVSGCCFEKPGEVDQPDPSTAVEPVTGSTSQPPPTAPMTLNFGNPEPSFGATSASENDGLTDERKAELQSAINAIRHTPWEERIALVLRSGTAHTTYKRMVHEGQMWDGIDVEFEHVNDIFSGVREISDRNIANLKHKLAALSSQERAFFYRSMTEEFYAVHFTNADIINPSTGEAEIYSRKKLIERAISFNETNTTQIDLMRTGADDFVFFSLETGAEPKKTKSRFGEVGMRFAIDDPVFVSCCWMNLLDFETDHNNWDVEKWIPGILTGLERDYINSMRKTDKGNTCVFLGSSMKEGLLLSIIDQLREVGEERRNKILEKVASGALDLNNLVNGLFRPQVMVPRHFFGTPQKSSGSAEPAKPRESM